ncbi:hypothetical protein TgHK011_002799 [Trichoderma gracile]|nr:hypothetical protein TgHK011_002799 [Trichoderma gracile]
MHKSVVQVAELEPSRDRLKFFSSGRDDLDQQDEETGAPLFLSWLACHWIPMLPCMMELRFESYNLVAAQTPESHLLLG